MGFLRKLLGLDKPDEPEQHQPAKADSSQTKPEAVPVSLEVKTTWRDTPPAQATPEVHTPTPSQPIQLNEFRVGRLSGVGQVRSHNEDALMTLTSEHIGDSAAGPFGFFVVADGMGGHQAGEVASSVAARVVTHRIVQDILNPYLLNLPPDANQEPLNEALKTAVKVANAAVHEQVPGGGTTLTCALMLGKRLYIAHVGDSRAYLVTSEGIKLLTQDHSFVGRLIELGELTPEEAAVHPQRNVLYRAVGQGKQLDIDTYTYALPNEGHLLLCSDGLWGQIPEEEIEQIVKSADSPQQACYELENAANRAGGPDNITSILIQIPQG